MKIFTEIYWKSSNLIKENYLSAYLKKVDIEGVEAGEDACSKVKVNVLVWENWKMAT